MASSTPSTSAMGSTGPNVSSLMSARRRPRPSRPWADSRASSRPSPPLVPPLSTVAPASFASLTWRATMARWAGVASGPHVDPRAQLRHHPATTFCVKAYGHRLAVDVHALDRRRVLTGVHRWRPGRCRWPRSPDPRGPARWRRPCRRAPPRTATGARRTREATLRPVATLPVKTTRSTSAAHRAAPTSPPPCTSCSTPSGKRPVEELAHDLARARRHLARLENPPRCRREGPGRSCAAAAPPGSSTA